MKVSWNVLRTLVLVLGSSCLAAGSVQSQSPSTTEDGTTAKAVNPTATTPAPNTERSQEQTNSNQVAEKQQQPSNPTSQEVPQNVPQQPLPATSVPLRVMVGKSLLVNTSDRLKRVSVTDPTIADALVVTPNQVLLHGRAPGEVSLLLWDEQERSRSFDLRVDVDSTAAAEEMKRIFP